MDLAWVGLTTRFTSGWPWPEESYGLDPMFGAGGWCHQCGTPLRAQSGSLIIQGRKFPTANVWMPNWIFDAICVSADVATEISERFSIASREVHKPRQSVTGVVQLLPAVTEELWYDPDRLSTAVRARHREYDGDRVGTRCSACSRWKWLPVSEGEAPIQPSSLNAESDLIASPEVFGDGLSAFRHLLFRKPLAEILVAANPRTWSVVPIEFMRD